MNPSDEHLRRAVDEALEPAWPRVRRSVVARTAAVEMCRVAGFVLAIGAMVAFVRVGIGAAIPWSFLAFIGSLAAFAVLHGIRTGSHLRRE